MEYFSRTKQSIFGEEKSIAIKFNGSYNGVLEIH